MNLKIFGLALAAGVATFIVAGVAVTELLQSRIEFSLLIGLPVGLLAGSLAATVVAWAVNEGEPPQRRRLATAFGAFGAGFLVVLLAGILLPFGTTIMMVIGVGVGILVAFVSYFRATGELVDHTDGFSAR